jgi:hypothetical protein
VRIALYFPRAMRLVDRFLRDEFHVGAVRIHAPDGNLLLSDAPADPVPEIQATDGYRACHYRIHLRPGSVDRSMRRFLAGGVEVQVASVIMHAWSEVEHDLRYKPSTGDLSAAETAILAELNRLTLAGEAQLQALHDAAEHRLSGLDRPLQDHFELAELIDRLLANDPVAGNQRLDHGRLDRLFELLQATGQARPGPISTLIDYLLPFDTEITVADQILDAMCRDRPDLYRTYMLITDPNDPTGVFIQAWSELERQLRAARNGAAGPVAAFTDVERDELRYLRRVRNLLIHDRQPLNHDQLVGLTFAVHRLQERLRPPSPVGADHDGSPKAP